MTLRTSSAERRRRLVPSSGHWESAYATPFGSACITSGVALVLASLVDYADRGPDTLALFVVGVAALAVGGIAWSQFRPPARYRTQQALTMLVVVWATMIVVGGLGLAFTDTFAAHDGWTRWSDALFESTSGFSTTGMTSIEVVQDTGKGVLFFRAASNWMGGLGALIVGVAVLPFVIGTRELGDQDRSRGVAATLAPNTSVAMRNVVQLYSGFTVLLILALVISGIGVFDGVAYGLAIASTGGFATHNGSLAAEHNALAEWIAIVGMFLAGTNLAIIWWALRGSVSSIWHSVELRIYLLTAAFGSVVVTIAVQGFDDLHASRDTVFAVASAMSSTGLVAFDWQGWHAGAQVVLMLMMTMGAMWASAGGGVHPLRIVVLWETARRELVRLVYPRVVHVVKIGDRPVSDDVVRSMAGYLVLFAGIVLGGAYLIGLFEDGLRLSLVAALSAATTSGLLLGVRAASDLADGSRLVLIPLMIAGRLAVVPVFVAFERLVSEASARIRSFVLRSHRR